MSAKKKYGSLRAIASIYRILGFIATAVFVIGIVMLFTGGPAFALPTIGGGLVGAISMFAVAESIAVVLDIEENTRRTADAVTSAAETRKVS